MADKIPTLTHATERDVDLILIEELKCSSEFVCWFTSQVYDNASQANLIKTWDVLHSVRRMRNRREIDIFLTVKNMEGENIGFLIENKLDASDQPDQAESYREECEHLVSAGEVNHSYAILVCPESYISVNSTFAAKFDAVVTYENVMEFMEKRMETEVGELAVRLAHRRNLMDQAVTKSRRGYEAIPVVEIDDFNSKYVTLCQRHFPGLIPGPSMIRVGRPGESKTMIFDPKTLTKYIYLPQTRIVHQLREGNVNINFYTWGNFFDDIATSIQTSLKETPFMVAATMNRRKGGSSGLMVYGETLPIDNLKPFDNQIPELLEGMKMVDLLRDWFEKNQMTIQEWSKQINELKNA